MTKYPIGAEVTLVADFLQVYRDGVNPGEVDEGLFDPIPPQKCVKGLGSATFRVGCDDEGYPIPDKVRRDASHLIWPFQLHTALFIQ